MEPKDTIDIVIVDKNPLVLRGLVALFSEDERFEIRATAEDGELFLKLLERFRFDIGIIGWKMPHLNGRQVLTALNERDSRVRVIVYSGASVAAQVQELGGAAFYAKSEVPEGLLEIAYQVGQGKTVFPYRKREDSTDSLFFTLTPRELEMLQLLAAGLSNLQISKSSKISQNTVKFHLKNLYDKLQVSSRVHAVSLYNRALNAEDP